MTFVTQIDVKAVDYDDDAGLSRFAEVGAGSAPAFAAWLKQQKVVSSRSSIVFWCRTNPSLDPLRCDVRVECGPPDSFEVVIVELALVRRGCRSLISRC